MEKENKEMDLFDLMEKMGSMCNKGFAKIGNALLWLIRFKLKNWLVLSVFTIAGFLLAFYHYLPENRTKYAEFRLQINGTSSFNVYDIISNLNQMIDVDNNNKSFAKLLNLDQEIVAPVQRIEPFFIIDLNTNKTPDYVDYTEAFEEDTLSCRMKNFLNIRIRVKGNSDYNAIQDALVNYLRKNPYLKREESERIEVIKNDIKVLEGEIAALDSMKRNDIKNSKYLIGLDSTAFVFQKPTYHSDIINLKKQKSNLQEELDLQANVVTIYSGVVVKPKRTDVFIFVSRMLPFILFGFILSLLITYRKKIKETLKS